MISKEHGQRIRQLMQELEHEMRNLGLWSGTPPSAQAMNSVMPFMYDTLHFHEWLQWVFIPRTLALIDAGRTPPGNCHIHPLAEHELARLKLESGQLLATILQIDTTMNQPHKDQQA